jgi:gliding motility-associated-like protein
MHSFKAGLLINSYSGNGLNQFLFTDLNGNISGSLLVNNPYGSLNGKGNIIVAADNGIYFQQSSGSSLSGFKDIIMHLDSNLQIRWQYDFSAEELNYTGWFQLSGAADLGVSGIGSGLLPNGLQTMNFMKLDSSGSGCHSDETDLQIQSTTALLLPFNWNTDIGFTMQVRDVPMNLNNIDIESHLFCPQFMNGCDLLKLEGSTEVCNRGDTIQYRLHDDPYCAESVKWNYDRESVTTIDSNQAGRLLRFEKTGEYIIKVEKSGCNNPADSMIVLVGSQIAKINLPPDTVLCTGSVMTLDPGTGFAKYLWQDGTTSESIQVQEKGQYRVQLTEKNGCISSDTTTIHSVEPLPVSFLPSDTVICSGDPWEAGPAHSFSSYHWSTGETSGTIQISNAGIYILQVVDGYGCVGTDSVRVETKKCSFGIFFPNAFTPNQDGLNDIFKPLITGRPSEYKLIIYNRWGQQVFETTDPGAGWNGRIENSAQETGTYIWTCMYRFNTQEKMIKKGSVVLLR